MMRFKITILILFGLTIFISCVSDKSEDIAVIEKGNFSAGLTETGELQAVVARHIVMPFLGFRYGYMNKLVGFEEHGTNVKKGDSVISVDPSNVMKFLVEKEGQLELEKANYEKTLVQQNILENQLKSQLDQQVASYNMEKLALGKAQFDSERNKQIRQLEFRKAEILLEKTRKKIEYNSKIAKLDKKIQSTKVVQLQNDTSDSNQALSKLILRSPNEGIFQIEYNHRTRQLYKAGDDAYPNRSLASIPDLRRMKVKTSVNEIDIDKIELGQKANVRLDAFPDLKFEGEISRIGKLSHKINRESTVKVFDVEVLVEENENEVLKPGMTVSCEIIIAELTEVLYVPNDCISRENGHYFINISQRGETIKTPVEVGARNNSHTVIAGDFNKGDKVVQNERIVR